VSAGAARPGRILLATDNPGRRGLTPEEVVRELSTQRATLERAVPFPPKVRLAHFTRDAPLVGAVALALDVAEPGRRPIRAAPADEKAAAHEQRKASRAGPRCGSYRLACHWQWNGGNACEPRRGSGG
jgi:hypothetical protein